MILLNEKDCVVNVSIIIAATANCRPVIFSEAVEKTFDRSVSRFIQSRK